MLLASLSFSPGPFQIAAQNPKVRHLTRKILRQFFRSRLDLPTPFIRQVRIRPAAGKMLRMVRRLSMSYKNNHIRIPYSPPVSDQRSVIPFYQSPLRIPALHRCLGTLFPLIFAARSTRHADPRSYAENHSD